MRGFSKALYPSVRDDTFFESCGVADLIATCYGGRNRLVALEFTRAYMVCGAPSGWGTPYFCRPAVHLSAWGLAAEHAAPIP